MKRGIGRMRGGDREKKVHKMRESKTEKNRGRQRQINRKA